MLDNLMTDLAYQYGIRILTRGLFVVVTLDVSEQEWKEIDAIDSSSYNKVYNQLASHLNYDGIPPPISILCFGAAARPPEVPEELASAFRHPLGPGVWLRNLGVACVKFCDWASIHLIIVHELSHALLDHLSHHYPFPLVLDEGIARRIEWNLGREIFGTSTEKDKIPTQGIVFSSGHISTSIRRLLENPIDKLNGVCAETDIRRFSDMALWLHGFLWEMGKSHRRLWYILPELRKRNLYTADHVMQWLCWVTGLEEREIELSFSRYCMTGHFADDKSSG